MTVNVAGRSRRRPAAADPEPAPKAPAKSTARRRAPATSRKDVAAASVPAEALPAPMIVPSPPARIVPPVPAEGPAVLHPSDRRGISAAPVRASFPAPVEQLAIGEIEQTLFDCPACRRPLALGSRRCPGCGIRLVGSIPLAKAASFVAVGLLGGVIAAAAFGAVGGGLRGSSPAPIVAVASATATGSPGVTGPGPGATSGATPSVSGPGASVPLGGDAIPSVTRSALVQVVGTNDRLAVAETQLRAALGASRFDASEVAKVLRSISADSVFGEQLALQVAAWPGSHDVGAELASFYGTIHDTAIEGLVNSVRNPDAYESAARSMAELLAGRATIDASIRSVAASAGVSLPAASTAP